MQTAMQPYADEMFRSHGITMQIRVGLNSGEVVVRTIGNDLHMDYSAVGQTTNLASRMEQLAAPGSITLTGATLRLLEAFGGDRLADQVERLAHHAFRGEIWEKAVSYFRQSADRTVARSAIREVAPCLEQALSALQCLPQSRQTHEQAIDLRVALIPGLQPLGDHSRLGRVLSYMAYCFNKGDFSGAISVFERSLTLLQGHEYSCFACPDQRGFRLCLQQALALATELGMRPLQAHCHCGLGTLYQQMGRVEQARAELSAAIDLYRNMEMAFWLPQAEATLAQVEA
jgi:tetratricopeptide (TPR) repeat protein